ncbi:MAG: DUF488 domain-containing protein [Gammaproteobacteria bacterium]
MQIRLKRAYDKPSKQDDTRILVDRVWPRGLKKEDAHIDHWLRDIAPSTELRKWFSHDPDKWTEFKRRYFGELDRNRDAVAELRKLAGKERVTLVFSARDEDHNNAVVLKDYLRQS